MHLSDLEPESQNASPLAGVDARLKIASSVIFVAAIVALPQYKPWWLVAAAGVLLFISLFARVSWRYIAIRIAIAAPVLLAIAASVPFLHGGTSVLFTIPEVGWTATREGLFAGISTTGKSLLCIWTATLLIGTTDFTHLLDGLSQLRAPSVVVMLMALMYRYIFVLGQETTRMLRAKRSRGEPPTRRYALRVGVSMVCSMLLRCFQRAERIAQAMVARGFDGTIPTLHPRRLPNRMELIGAISLGLVMLCIVGASYLL